jgi:hypothetical protein
MLSVVIALLLFGHSSSRAQRAEPISPAPEIGAPDLYRGCHGGTLREICSMPLDSLQPKLAVDPDTAVILPGSRDFLEPNFPNPFGQFGRQTDIAYSLSAEAPVELKIYDFFYNEVMTLVDGDVQPAGRHVVPFDPPPTMPTGMYFYELKTPRYRELRRMMYIR